MKPRAEIDCVLIDPSLYTGPYDAALTEGLLSAGVRPIWATRPTRRGDLPEIPPQHAAPLFYKHVDDAVKLPGIMRTFLKGVSHLVGLVRLMALIARRKPDVIHIQWVVLPLLDIAALWFLRLRRPLIMTVHDPVPYNGQRLSLLQQLGFDLPIRLANQVIVHTRRGRQTLIERGIDASRIAVIPHGPLRLRVAPQKPAEPRDARWTFVLFGEIKPYKGLDVLVEAFGLLPLEVRDQTRLVVAGRPRMDLAPVIERIDQLRLQTVIELRLRRLPDQEMSNLFAEADCFVFPYREIDASGVYFLTKGLGKWIIASRIGIFAEDVVGGSEGQLVDSDDAEALARELERAIQTRPTRPSGVSAGSWTDIGCSTRALYERAMEENARSVAPRERADA